jgi:hypothetical protein
MPDFNTDDGAPGIAEYRSETWGNRKELRLQDQPAVATRNVEITAGVSDLDLPLFGVVSAGGLTAQGSTPLGILTAPVSLPAGQSMNIDVIVAGYLDYTALKFAASFTTDAQKQAAFNGAPAPINIILDKNPYESAAIVG